MVIVKGCPRCKSVVNVKSRLLPESRKNVGDKTCHWCGKQFHETEMVDVEVPGPEPVEKEKEARQREPYFFDLPKLR